MARVVCQVLVSPDRLTFLWSDGTAPFEPYHQTGDTLREFHALAHQAHERLHQLAARADEGMQAGFALAQAGHELYRGLFRADAGQADAAVAVQGWLAGLARDNAIERLEILTDAPTLLPWNALHEQVPDEHSFHTAAGTPQAWESFFCTRHGLTVDRRVSPLRARPVLDRPAVLLACDPALRQGLPEEQRKRLHDLAQGETVRIVESAEELARALADDRPDFLYLLCRVSGSSLLLGSGALAVDRLRELLRRDSPRGEGHSDTFVFLNACRGADSDAQADVTALLHALATRATLGPAAPLPVAFADSFGLDFLAGFLTRGERVGKLLHDLRARTAPLGLLYGACCPAALRVRSAGQALPTAIQAEGGTPAAGTISEADEGPEPLPLPATPYRSLAPYEAEDRPLFIGREEDTENVAELLGETGVCLVLLHGRSGVGKASLLRAGVVPYLEEECHGFRLMDNRAADEEGAGTEGNYPILMIRATDDLAGQLASALAVYCAQPYRYTTPVGKEVVVDLPAVLTAAVGVGAATPAVQESGIKEPETGIKPPADDGRTAPPPLPAPAAPVPAEEAIRVALRRQPDLTGRILAALTERLPHELVLIVEQGEEIFSLARKPENDARSAKALAILRGVTQTSARARLLVSLRTEYVGRLVEAFPHDSGERAKVRSYLLPELDKEALLEAILLPTATEAIPGSTQVPWLRYLFRYEAGVPERIVEEALKAGRERQQPVLALVQVMCGRMYQVALRRAERVIRAQDLTETTTPPPWWKSRTVATLLGLIGARPVWAEYFRGVQRPVVGSTASLSTYVDFLLNGMFEGRSATDREAFEKLLEDLYFRQPDGTAVRDLVAEEEIAKGWKGRVPLETVLDEAAGEDVRLLEVDWLNIGGREGRYVSLGHDVLAAEEARRAEERQRSWYGRERIKDTLWIMIPLLILAGVFAWTRIMTASNLRTELEKNVKTNKEVRDKESDWQGQALGARWPLYVSQLVQAQEALRLGDSLRARQYLQMQWPLQDTKDNRSFEWYYLKRQAQGERHDLLGHRGTVAAVALSADGTLLASAGQDGTVRLWDAVKGQIRAAFKGHKGPVHAVAFAPDAKTLASAGEDGTVFLWDATAGQDGKYVGDAQPRQTLADHKGAVRALAYAPDGRSLASAGADKKIRLWNVGAKEKSWATRDGHTGEVLALAYAPDGNTLAAGDDASAVKLWDVSAAAKKKEPTSLDGHSGPVRALAYAPDGKVLATAALEKKDGFEFGSVRLWDVARGKESVALAPAPTAIWALAFSGDGKTLATGGADDAVRLWDAATGKRRGALHSHVGWVRSVAFSADGKTLASGGYDAAVKVWDPKAAPSEEVLRGHKDWVNAVVFSPDDKWLASAGADGAIKLWDAATGKEGKELKGHKGAVLALSFSPDGKALASAGADSTVRIWDSSPESKTFGGERVVLRGHTAAVHAVEYAPTGKAVVSGGGEGAVRLWLVNPDGAKEDFGKEFMAMRHKPAVRAVVFLPGTPLLVTAGDDLNLRVWDLKGGKLVGEPLAGHTAAVQTLAYWPGSRKFVVSGAADRTLKLWDVEAGKEVTTLRGHLNGVSAVAFSSGEAPLCVSGGWDGLVKLWNPILGERFTLTGHTGPVQAVAIATDRRTIASAGRDGTVRLWRAAAEPSVPRHD